MEWQDGVSVGLENDVTKEPSPTIHQANEVPHNIENLSPLTCEVCKKSLKNKESLRKHKATHTTVPSKCDVCDKEFSSLAVLRKHRTTVHNATVFSCNDCTKRFTEQKNLKAHIKTIHDMKKSNCSVCDKSFGETYLKRHEISCKKKCTSNIQQHRLC